MKKNIIKTLFVLITVLSVSTLFAQGWGRGGNCNGPGYGRGNHMQGYGNRGYSKIDYMKAELGLSDKQVKQIFDIGTEYREKFFENRNNPDKILELRIQHRKAIKKVLTKEQREKFDNLRNAHGRVGWYGGCPYR